MIGKLSGEDLRIIIKRFRGNVRSISKERLISKIGEVTTEQLSTIIKKLNEILKY